MPDDFLTRMADAGDVRNGLRQCEQQRCVAHLVALTPDKTPSLIIFLPYNGWVFDRDATGVWRRTGLLDANDVQCPKVRTAIRQGELRLAPHTLPDIVIGDRTISVQRPPVACGAD